MVMGQKYQNLHFHPDRVFAIIIKTRSVIKGNIVYISTQNARLHNSNSIFAWVMRV